MNTINEKDYIAGKDFVVIRQGIKGEKHDLCTWVLQCPISQPQNCDGCPAHSVFDNMVTRKEAIKWWEEQ